MRVGFLVNPVAGSGSLLGYKGSNLETYIEIKKVGLKSRAEEIAEKLSNLLEEFKETTFITPNGIFGEKYIKNYNKVIINVGNELSPAVTKKFAEILLNWGVNLVMFVGGDGTARDLVEVVNSRIPILGIPSGVKMYSGVFAESPEHAVEILRAFIDNKHETDYEEVLDLDNREIESRSNGIRYYGKAMVVKYKDYLVPSKSLIYNDNKLEVARYFVEKIMESGVVYLIGPGSTTKSILELLGLNGSELGFDAIINGKIMGTDLKPWEIRRIVSTYETKLVLSPIGKQGFLLGRGNQEITPEIIKKIKKENIIIIATKAKVLGLNKLRVYLNDREVEDYLKGYYRVIIGYGEEIILKVE
jgi:predicted polyphosphate/ATP-dependent NAD kinase